MHRALPSKWNTLGPPTRMRKLFQLDPRIVQALASQRRLIALGLGCVAITSLLTSLIIPLTDLAIRSIDDAASAGARARNVPYAEQLRFELGNKIPLSKIERELEASFDGREGLPPVSELAPTLGISEAELAAAYERLGPTPKQGLERAASQTRVMQMVGLDRLPPTQRLGVICLVVVGVFLLKYGFTRGHNYFLSEAALRLANELRSRLYAKLQTLPISYFGKNRVGAIQSVMTQDINVYQTAVNLMRDSIEGPFKAIFALIMILFIQWKLAVVAMLFIPILAWFVQRNGQKMKRDTAMVQENLADLNAFTQEALNGTRVVKAFAAEDRMNELFGKQADRAFKSQLRAAKRFGQLRPMVELLGACSLAVVLYTCGHMAAAGELQVSQIIALTLALDTINQGARALSNVNNTYNQVQAASDRIHSLVLDIPSEDVTSDGKATPGTTGRVEFKNVGFQYGDGNWALRNVSFAIEPGQSLALVGPSGAGKSTLADLLLRFYDPTEGQILYDGVDIRELDLRAYRERFGVVPQQTFLFAGTIAENIRLGKPDATREQLERAALLAHCSGFIERSEDGLETQLGERGSRLSGGEGQRLAIARALVREPSVLLLDEATSNLDAESEKAVTEALDEVMVGRTTLFIVHRLTSAMRADQVMVLVRGEIMEMGSPQELMARDGAFSGMMRTFTGGLSGELIG